MARSVTAFIFLTVIAFICWFPPAAFAESFRCSYDVHDSFVEVELMDGDSVDVDSCTFSRGFRIRGPSGSTKIGPVLNNVTISVKRSSFFSGSGLHLEASVFSRCLISFSGCTITSAPFTIRFVRFANGTVFSLQDSVQVGNGLLVIDSDWESGSEMRFKNVTISGAKSHNIRFERTTFADSSLVVENSGFDTEGAPTAIYCFLFFISRIVGSHLRFDEVTCFTRGNAFNWYSGASSLKRSSLFFNNVRSNGLNLFVDGSSLDDASEMAAHNCTFTNGVTVVPSTLTPEATRVPVLRKLAMTSSLVGTVNLHSLYFQSIQFSECSLGATTTFTQLHKLPLHHFSTSFTFQNVASSNATHHASAINIFLQDGDSVAVDGCIIQGGFHIHGPSGTEKVGPVLTNSSISFTRSVLGTPTLRNCVFTKSSITFVGCTIPTRLDIRDTRFDNGTIVTIQDHVQERNGMYILQSDWEHDSGLLMENVTLSGSIDHHIRFQGSSFTDSRMVVENSRFGREVSPTAPHSFLVYLTHIVRSQVRFDDVECFNAGYGFNWYGGDSSLKGSTLSFNNVRSSGLQVFVDGSTFDDDASDIIAHNCSFTTGVALVPSTLTPATNRLPVLRRLCMTRTLSGGLNVNSIFIQSAVFAESFLGKTSIYHPLALDEHTTTNLSSSLLISNCTCNAASASLSIQPKSTRHISIDNIQGCNVLSIVASSDSGQLSIHVKNSAFTSAMQFANLRLGCPTCNIVLENVEVAYQIGFRNLALKNASMILMENVVMDVPGLSTGVAFTGSSFSNSSKVVFREVRIVTHSMGALFQNSNFYDNSSLVLECNTYLEATATLPALRIHLMTFSSGTRFLVLGNTTIKGLLETYSWSSSFDGLLFIDRSCTLGQTVVRIFNAATFIWDSPRLFENATLEFVHALNNKSGAAASAPPIREVHSNGMYLRLENYTSSVPWSFNGEIRKFYMYNCDFHTGSLFLPNFHDIRLGNEAAIVFHRSNLSAWVIGSSQILNKSVILIADCITDGRGGSVTNSLFTNETSFAVIRSKYFAVGSVSASISSSTLSGNASFCWYHNRFHPSSTIPPSVNPAYQAITLYNCKYDDGVDVSIVGNIFNYTIAGTLRATFTTTLNDDGDLAVLSVNNTIHNSNVLFGDILPTKGHYTALGNQVVDVTREADVAATKISRNRDLSEPPIVRYAMCNSWGPTANPFTITNNNPLTRSANFKVLPCTPNEFLRPCLDMALPFAAGASPDLFAACKPATTCQNFFANSEPMLLDRTSYIQHDRLAPMQSSLDGTARVPTQQTWYDDVEDRVLNFPYTSRWRHVAAPLGPAVEVCSSPTPPTMTRRLSKTMSITFPHAHSTRTATSVHTKALTPTIIEDVTTYSATRAESSEPATTSAETHTATSLNFTTSRPSTEPITEEPSATNVSTEAPSTPEPPKRTVILVAGDAKKALLEGLFDDDKKAAEVVTTTTTISAVSAGLGSPGAGGAVARMGGIVDSVNCLYSEDQFVEPPEDWLPISGFNIDEDDVFGKMSGFLVTNVLILLVLPMVLHFAVLGSLFSPKVILENDLVGIIVKSSCAVVAILHAYFVPTFFGVITVVVAHSSSGKCIATCLGCGVIIVAAVLFPMRHMRSRAKYDQVCHEIKPSEIIKVIGKGQQKAGSNEESSRSSSEEDDADEEDLSSSSASTGSSVDVGMQNITPRGGGASVKSVTTFDNANDRFPYVEIYGAFFDPFHNTDTDAKARTFFLWEQCISSLILILSNVRPRTGNCMFIASPILLISCVHLAYLSYVRPYDSRLEFLMVYFHAVMGVGMGIVSLAIVGSDGSLDDDSGTAKILAGMVVAEGMVFIVQTATMLFWAWYRERHRRTIRMEFNILKKLRLGGSGSSGDGAQSNGDDVEMDAAEVSDGTGSSSGALHVPLLADESRDNPLQDNSIQSKALV